MLLIPRLHGPVLADPLPRVWDGARSREYPREDAFEMLGETVLRAIQHSDRIFPGKIEGKIYRGNVQVNVPANVPVFQGERGNGG